MHRRGIHIRGTHIVVGVLPQFGQVFAQPRLHLAHEGSLFDLRTDGRERLHPLRCVLRNFQNYVTLPGTNRLG